jgi:hypothetical protein
LPSFAEPSGLINPIEVVSRASFKNRTGAHLRLHSLDNAARGERCRD